MNNVDTKSQKYFAVSRAILETIESEGPMHVTHSQVSRLSNVSRAWIYEYMGREREDLINVAADVFGSFFIKATTSIEVHTIKELKALLLEGQEISFQNVRAEPVIIKLYYRFRGTETPIGAVIKKYEKHWLEFITSHLERILKLEKEKAHNYALTILILRLGFYHRMATSSNPDKDYFDAKETIDLVHQQIFG